MEYVLLLALLVSITTPARQIEVVRKDNMYLYHLQRCYDAASITVSILAVVATVAIANLPFSPRS